MAEASKLGPELVYHPVTPDRWSDLERLFGPSGACSGCWCMYWRIPRKQWSANGNRGNHEALAAIVAAGPAPGILAYAAGEPIAWCSIAPREAHAALERSRVLARVDDRPVWSITCFFVAKTYRRQGLMEQLIEAAVDYAGNQGASVVEAYPTDIGEGQKLTGSSGYMGSVQTFARTGFVEVARRGYGHLIVRREMRERTA